jgi:hypothetical protein
VQGVKSDAVSGEGEFDEQGLRGRDLVGFLVDVQTCEHEGGFASEGTEDLRGGAVVEIVEAGAHCLAIDGNADLSDFREGSLEQDCMATKASFQRFHIEPVKNVADGGMRRRAAAVEVEDRVRVVTMGVDEADETPIGVGSGDDGEDAEQKHMRKLMEPALRPARIGHVFQQAQQRCECSHGNLRLGCRPTSQTSPCSGIPLLLTRFTLTRGCCIPDSPQPIR